MATTTTVAPGGHTTSTSLVGEPVASYEVVARVSDPAGETLFIVIPEGAYTDVDIENFVVGLVDSGEVTYGAEIFDNPGAVDAYRKPEAERTEGGDPAHRSAPSRQRSERDNCRVPWPLRRFGRVRHRELENGRHAAA